MKDLNKRLVEIEAILKRIDDRYQNKIPSEIWKNIKQNKDKNYEFYFDDSKPLENQKLHIDTIAMLTYINIQYLLDEKQKQDMVRILKEDDECAEEKEEYNNEELIKNKQVNYDIKEEVPKTNCLGLVKYKESFFRKIINAIKKVIYKGRQLFE